MIYFISDLHFGSNAKTDKDILQNFEGFCDELNPRDQLCLLGDFFDFWLEYSAFVPKMFINVYSILLNTVKRGVRIIYIRGNHDFFRGDFFVNLGIEVRDKYYEFDLGRKKIIATHGDEIKFGIVRSITKFILRNPLFQTLYKFLPTNFAFWLMANLSELSYKKHISKGLTPEDKERFRKMAFEFLKNGPHDILIAGHSHIVELKKENNKIYANTGEWRKRPTYIALDKNFIFLKEFGENGLNNDVVLEKMEV